ncbi:MAG TPA: aminopeptidase P family protein, partial [Candidatus Melainabacteria bacterium]|nr:aminopeptidase P family protein [Candidatus Melainabacteria bacterium]
GKKVSGYINEALKLARLNKDSIIGFEADRVPYALAQNWMKALNCKLKPTHNLVESLRQYKDEQEIKLIRDACRKTSKVYNEVMKIIKPGMREIDVAMEIDFRLRKYGAQDNSFQTIVASGPNSAIPHHATGARKLKAGEPVVMDFGGVFDGGYCSDITRTIFVPGKKPGTQMKEIYEIVLEANKRARKALNPEMKVVDYDRVARDYIESRGYGKYFTHGLGHSLGMEAHDPFDYQNSPLAVGTVITDEPGIYIEDVGGVRIEDDLVVTAGGAVKLTNAPYWKF